MYEKDREIAPTESVVGKFAYLSPMLESALAEMRDFAKKKPDAIVSAKKISIINRILKDIQNVLSHEESVSYLHLLSDDELPQNSDAVIVLGQYQAALNSFQSRNFRRVKGDNTWITKEWIDRNYPIDMQPIPAEWDEDEDNCDSEETSDDDDDEDDE